MNSTESSTTTPHASYGCVLDGIKVIDLSSGVAGQFAARVLGEYGADVVLLEPPGGCALRHPQAIEDRYLFWHLNSGKKSITIDLNSEQGRQILEHLIQSCDVVIGDSTHDLQVMCQKNPRLIACRIRDFSPQGPYANWIGNEMIHQALSGLMYTTGRADDKPLYGFGHRAYYSAGAIAVSSILGALIMRDGNSTGQHLEVSVHETAVSMSQNPVTQFAYNATWMARGPYPGPFDIFQCADGWVSMYCRGDRWSALCKGLGAPQVAEHPELSSIDNLVKNWSLAYQLLQPIVKKLTVEQFLAIVEAARGLASRVNTMKDVLDCNHLAHRDYWHTLPDGNASKPVLGPLFRFSKTSRVLQQGAPDLKPVSMSIKESHDK